MPLIKLLSGGLRDLTTRPRGNVPFLDVLRSLAILLVFTSHFAGEFHASAAVVKFPFVYYGWTGVDLFFVLSGFLIGSQLWKEVKQGGNVKVGAFLLRRGLRIWPLYFSFILMLLLEIAFLGRTSSGLLADATFLSNYFHCQVGGSWSLSTEEQFYILAPLSVYLIARRLKLRNFWVIPVAGLTILIISRALTIRFSALPYRALEQKLYFPIHTHADGLAVGLLLSWITVTHGGFLKSASRRLALASVMILCGAALYKLNSLLFDYTSLGLIFGAAACYGTSALKWMPAFVNWNGFYVLSRLSYGIYLNHFGVLPHLYSVFGKWSVYGGTPAFWICYAASLLICLLVAGVTFCLIEHPFLVLRSRWLSGARDPKLALAG
jgi:peptidoglycan/LPS O-acetylase OafA/YrhL